MVDQKRRVPVRLEEPEQPLPVGVRREVVGLDGRADPEVAVANLGAAGLQNLLTGRPLDLVAEKQSLLTGVAWISGTYVIAGPPESIGNEDVQAREEVTSGTVVTTSFAVLTRIS